jgi:hypothetical protein
MLYMAALNIMWPPKTISVIEKSPSSRRTVTVALVDGPRYRVGIIDTGEFVAYQPDWVLGVTFRMFISHYE